MGHKGILYNEKELARSARPYIDPEPILGMTETKSSRIIHYRMDRQKRKMRGG